MTFRQAFPVLAVLLLLAAGGALVFARLVTVRSDMADFLPAGSTPAARLLLDELRSGAAASLLLVGIEGAPPDELVRISQGVAERLRESGLFSLVANGSEDVDPAARDFLFEHRYLLSPATTADAFTVAGLREHLRALLDQLNGSAAPLAKRFGLADPIGAFTALVRIWIGESRVEQRDGAWFAAGGDRALLLARARAGSLDVAAGRAALEALDAAFAAAQPGTARLVVSGPGVFAVASAMAIRADVRLISIVSSLLVAAFLLWRHRSVYVLAAAAIPLSLGVLAGALAVQLFHGFVHAITLGFGLTMLGVAADYPLLLIGQRAEVESTLATARRVWPIMAIAAGTAALGLTAMLLSSFPGLSQLGLFSATGLLVAAAATRWLLPHLVADVAFRGQQAGPGWLSAARSLRRRRAWLLLPVVAAVLALAAGGAPAWETELENLSPVPQSARDLDEKLRRQLGAPDVRHLVAISGPDLEAVLEASERLDRVVADLARRGAVGGAELPSRYLPSRRTQLARQAVLPPREELVRRLEEAGNGLPFRPSAWTAFLDNVGAERGMGLVGPADLVASPALAARVDPLLFQREGRWYGLAALTDVTAPEAVRDAVAGLGDPALAYVDLKAETERLVAGYTREAVTSVALGAALLLVALAVTLRRPAAVLRVAAPIACAIPTTLAFLGLLGIRLTLFHLAALLLMTGVSVDYALFLNRAPADADEDSRTLGSVLNCNATTLLTFGLLALCHNPVLRGIGVTVASGVLAALIFAVGLSRARTP